MDRSTWGITPLPTRHVNSKMGGAGIDLRSIPFCFSHIRCWKDVRPPPWTHGQAKREMAHGGIAPEASSRCTGRCRNSWNRSRCGPSLSLSATVNPAMTDMAVMMTNRPLLRHYTQHPKIRRNSKNPHSQCTILTAPYRAEIPFSRSVINKFSY